MDPKRGRRITQIAVQCLYLNCSDEQVAEPKRNFDQAILLERAANAEQPGVASRQKTCPLPNERRRSRDPQKHRYQHQELTRTENLWKK